ncbi:MULTISPECIES: streptomycin biosynthesis protein [Amycolatopsis]|uniref:Streptomycin biosynthesis protein n=1 Tax=Amycolatopsis dendrobii TaxID=2760662 RepID=A0A7W3W3X8_9PSEU|nr:MULTISPECIES: streptomycin biosynthesis protein [Amycolatopsis]MBB1158394.1 streptomycin biosynthesis protein [Amycolatopsis dendrobii]UKD56900.1 streptomycin biosynthesis protein [Amycolatopsis sp. FU40]
MVQPGRPPRDGMRGESGACADWARAELEGCPVEQVAVAGLSVSGWVRGGGGDDAHVGLLAETEADLPPIVVHVPSMRVVDGVHRVRAAAARGRASVAAVLYAGSAADAFVLSVWLNRVHGLPLDRVDRRAAAERILVSHGHWSDRRIAAAVGLAAGTVAGLRGRSTGQNDQLDRRVGRDGRGRPVNAAAGRRLAGKLLTEEPGASLRSVARRAGVSPATVQDVRRRLSAGDDPVPAQRRGSPPPRRVQSWAVSAAELRRALEQMKRDPALRLSESGRALLRWLDRHAAGIAEWGQLVQAVPSHCRALVAEFARVYAAAWADLAGSLENSGAAGLETARG